MFNNSIKKSKRFIELDSLRGISIMLVLISHYTWAYDYHFNLLSEHYFHFPYGEVGVKLFFMISGFVILMTIEKTIKIKLFIISRFSRLFPTYWFCMLISISVLLYFPVPTLGHYTLSEFLVNLTMLQGFFKVRHIDQVYWSLGVELLFYCIIGWIFILNLIRKIEWICIFWLALCLTSLIFDFYHESKFKVLFMLIDAPMFIAGMMFYKCVNNYPKYIYIIIILLSYIISQVTTYLSGFEERQYSVSILLHFLNTGVFVIFYFAIIFKLKIFSNRILIFLGNISFPLYLLHNIIGYAIIYQLRQITNNQAIYTLATAILCISLAYLVSKFIEKPSNIYVKEKLINLFGR